MLSPHGGVYVRFSQGTISPHNVCMFICLCIKENIQVGTSVTRSIVLPPKVSTLGYGTRVRGLELGLGRVRFRATLTLTPTLTLIP